MEIISNYRRIFYSEYRSEITKREFPIQVEQYGSSNRLFVTSP